MTFPVESFPAHRLDLFSDLWPATRSHPLVQKQAFPKVIEWGPREPARHIGLRYLS
jgi:hypothetical protein